MPKIHKVFLAGIDFEFSEREIYNYFCSIYRSIEEVDIVKQRKKRVLNKGFGFMTLWDSKEMDDMLKRVFFYYKGRRFLVKEYKKDDRLQKEKDSFNKRRVFIRNVEGSVTNRQLYDYFASIVELEDAFLIRNNKLSPNERRNQNQSRTQYGYLVVKHFQDVEFLLSEKFYLINNYYAKVEKFKRSKTKEAKNSKISNNYTQYKNTSTEDFQWRDDSSDFVPRTRYSSRNQGPSFRQQDQNSGFSGPSTNYRRSSSGASSNQQQQNYQELFDYFSADDILTQRVRYAPDQTKRLGKENQYSEHYKAQSYNNSRCSGNEPSSAKNFNQEGPRVSIRERLRTSALRYNDDLQNLVFNVRRLPELPQSF